MKDNEYEIPENATIRQERVRCGNPDCQQFHGPYLYEYWKDGKRLRKKYVGKTIADLVVRKVAKIADTTPTKMRKLKVIKEKAQWGNLVAYKALVNSIREQRMLKMLTIAQQRRLNHNNPDELIELIASEMRKQGLDPTNEDNVDSCLNSKIM
jgi:hypothetical protein